MDLRPRAGLILLGRIGVLWACAAALLIVMAGIPLLAQTADNQKNPRFLVIYEQDSLLPANIEMSEGLKKGIAEAGAGNAEVYSEFLDLTRFPDVEQQDRVFQAIQLKYANKSPDVVIAVGPNAFQSVLRYRDQIGSDMPVLFAAANPDKAILDANRNVGGVVSRFDVPDTLSLARRLQPEANRIVIVNGASDFDQGWYETARAALGDVYEGLPVTYINGEPIEDILSAVSRLDPRAIVFILTVYTDPNGNTFVPREAATAISAASAAPTYGPYDTYVGNGVMGGMVNTFRSIGETAGRIAAEFAAGEVTLPEVRETPRTAMVDWRQMKRFGLDIENLPEGADLQFYDPGIFERYWLEIWLAFAVIGLQAATIAALVIQERRRKRLAEAHLTDRMELIHLARRTQLGELSGALAHELNQPLTSILANAEAGQRLLQRDPPDIGEVREILSDIASSDMRASEVISQLRGLLTRGEVALEVVDLNQVVSATQALVRSELLARQTRLEIRRSAGPAMVRGNRGQLQQVLLNLITNALDAMDGLDPDKRRMVVEVGAREDGKYELAVIDKGPGFPDVLESKAFRPFVSSKEAGLGLGLSICKTIAEAHDGTIGIDSAYRDGTRVALILDAA